MFSPSPLITAVSLGKAALMAGGFMLFMFVGHLVLPGFKKQGEPLRDGSRLSYKMTGLQLFVLTYLLVGAATWLFGFSLKPLVEEFWSLLIVVNLISFIYTAILFVVGRRSRKARNEEGQALWLDLWVGPELNPTFLGVDLKMWTYQPSLIGLGLVHLAFAYAQYETYGSLTTQMALYQAFWWLYLFTHYIYEDFMLQTWDVIAENFGFMLVWGDLVYVPFFYSICGWFLVDQTTSISWPVAAALVLMFTFCIWVFRGSNLQKWRFKKDPGAKIWGKPAEAMDGRLLVSGFWGWGRKLNYTGEIGVYFSFALTTGFISPIPYVLPVSLVILLTHRAWRDENRCSTKYGELWVRYCQRVRFRMFPFIY